MAAFCLGSLIFFVYGANAHQSTSCAVQWTAALKERGKTSTGYAEFCTWKQKLAKPAVRCYSVFESFEDDAA